MEEKRFDPYQFIGFVLIALILTWMLYVNRPDEVVSPEVKLPSTESINEQVQPALTKLNDSLNRINIENMCCFIVPCSIRSKTKYIVLETISIRR